MNYVEWAAILLGGGSFLGLLVWMLLYIKSLQYKERMIIIKQMEQEFEQNKIDLDSSSVDELIAEENERRRKSDNDSK